eukprot:COSAG06_NODE_310_length_17775_cov_9.971374_14_plen_113_part_00
MQFVVLTMLTLTLHVLTLQQFVAIHHSFLSFPYVCPEPVLAKRSFLYVNGSKSVSARAVSRVRSGGSQPWCRRSEQAWGGDRQQLLATGMNAIHVKRVRAQGFGSPPLRRHR